MLRADPLLAPLVTGLAAFVLLGMMVNVVTVFLVRDTLHASAGWYGGLGALLQGASVASLVIGGALAAVLDPRQIFLLAGLLGAVVMAVAAAAVTGGGRAASAPVPDVEPLRYFVRH